MIVVLEQDCSPWQFISHFIFDGQVIILLIQFLSFEQLMIHLFEEDRSQNIGLELV